MVCMRAIRTTASRRLLQPTRCRISAGRSSSSSAVQVAAFSTSAHEPPPPSTAPVQPYLEGNSTHFGFQQVPIEQKEHRVKHVFEKVADRYDFMNDVLSGGLQRYWKDYLLDMSRVESIAQVARQRNTPFKILDVAGGTGDIAFRFVSAAQCVERAKSSGTDLVQTTVLDINDEMLRVGQQRARSKFGNGIFESQALRFIQGNAQELRDLPDHHYDLYTIAFGLRNVTDVDAALSEAYRVLKPGGRFMCLEFSHVQQTALQPIYDAYSFVVIPWLGQVLANDRDSYQYLVESIRQFDSQEQLLQRLNRTGFMQTRYTNLTGGMVALHEGYKPLEE